MPAPAEPRPKPGLGVDSRGGAVIDPTENVKDLSKAANERQDDLRDADRRFFQSQIDNLTMLMRVNEEHHKELRSEEAKRLDEKRQVDVLAATTATDRQLQAIQVLAATTQANADTLRAAVANTATTIAAQTAATIGAIVERIANLEKAQYTGQGRSAVSDPRLDALIDKVDSLATSRNQQTGSDAGKTSQANLILGVVSAFGGGGVAAAVMSLMRH